MRPRLGGLAACLRGHPAKGDSLASWKPMVGGTRLRIRTTRKRQTRASFTWKEHGAGSAVSTSVA